MIPFNSRRSNLDCFKEPYKTNLNGRNSSEEIIPNQFAQRIIEKKLSKL